MGKPVAKDAIAKTKGVLVSECPLAGSHILQGMERLQEDKGEKHIKEVAPHPIEILAKAYGF